MCRFGCLSLDGIPKISRMGMSRGREVVERDGDAEGETLVMV